MKGQFSFFKNDHLRKAFALRKKGDYDGALAELKKGCEENDGESLFVMGETLESGGFGLKRDELAALAFYKESALAGCPWGMFRYAFFQRELDDHQRKVWFEKVYDSQDAFARGCCYTTGKVVEQNRGLAGECFLQASKEGNILARPCLATFDANNDMFLWVEKASLDGDVDGVYWMGFAFEHGMCVKKDERKAFEWYNKGALQKHNACLVELSRCYENGIGCVQDVLKSALLYVEAEAGYEICQRLTAKYDDERLRLRELFIYGQGMKANEQLQLKVETENEEGSLNLTRIFEESCNSARKAVLSFVWICKRNNLLNRDLRRLIGEIVWETRQDPLIWSVSL